MTRAAPNILWLATAQRSRYSGAPAWRGRVLVLPLKGNELADQGRWFKLWASAVSDPHLRALSLEDFGRWCALGIYLKIHGQDGRLAIRAPALPLQELLRLPSFDAVVATLQTFPNCTAVTVTNSPVTLHVEWSNWQRYQGDYSGDRVRRWRHNRKRSSNDDVTPKEEKRSRRDEKRHSSHSAKTDEDFMASIRANPAYAGIDVDKELARMDAWLLTPKAKGRKKTRAFIVNWLNRIDRPVSTIGASPENPGRFGLNLK